MRQNIAIQKSQKGYRPITFIPFTDDEGNIAAEVTGIIIQSECEWYEDIQDAIRDAKDFIFTPAPWSVSTTFHYKFLGPNSQEVFNARIAYFLEINCL